MLKGLPQVVSMRFIGRVTGSPKEGYEAGFTIERGPVVVVGAEDLVATFETHAEGLKWIKEKSKELGIRPEEVIWEEESEF